MNDRCPEFLELQEFIATLTTSFNDFKTKQELRHELYLHSFQTLHHRIESSSSATHHPPPGHNIKPPKLKLHSFDGSNPLDWIFQADQYFNHYSIDAPNRLSRIYCYMTGLVSIDAQQSFSNYLRKFKRSLELRFGSSACAKGLCFNCDKNFTRDTDARINNS
jgi:hypothetical protein